MVLARGLRETLVRERDPAPAGTLGYTRDAAFGNALCWSLGRWHGRYQWSNEEVRVEEGLRVCRYPLRCGMMDWVWEGE